MSDEAEVTMLMYAQLSSKGKSTLKSIDRDVWKALSDKGIEERAIWTSQAGRNGRSVQLVIAGSTPPKVLFELSEDEVACLTGSEILSRLRENLE